MAIITHGRLLAFGPLNEIVRTVSQRRLVEIQLTSDGSVETAAAVVREHVESDADVTASTAEGTVRFQTSKSEDELSRLLAQLVQNEVAISQFREVPTDLEDTFLSITRQMESATQMPSDQ